MKKNIAGLLCLFCLALLAGCGSKGGDGPPPDLTGRWRQVMDGGTPTFYQVAEIEGDRIRTWWRLSDDDSEEIYDLQGHRVTRAEMRKGVYIIKTKNRTYKVNIR